MPLFDSAAMLKLYRKAAFSFPIEPILRVDRAAAQGQLVEPIVINALHFQSLIATKAARFRIAAPEALLVDFGLRRAHGTDAGLLAARAVWIAGFDGTATVMAEPAFGVPIYGTMAHSYIQAFGDEYAAFEHFARVHPGNTVLLIDTYDTAAAAGKVVDLAHALEAEDININAVRIDSGDLGAAAVEVRRILDQGGYEAISIFVSGGLDEFEVERLIRDGAPIDGYGIGTQLDCSADRPYLDCAYKLQEYAGQARRKRSEGKATWPGRKQLVREYDESGRFSHDTLALIDEKCSGDSLLQPVMKHGKRLRQAENAATIRERAAAQLGCLPDNTQNAERKR
ncbi:MAG: nicotinate phosphoribosyltransferase [Gammaproteobacteria bacterium]|nr:nicotinate phosphoribosyltransferase [Gammaproteobacteria bacterium]